MFVFQVVVTLSHLSLFYLFDHQGLSFRLLLLCLLLLLSFQLFPLGVRLLFHLSLLFCDSPVLLFPESLVVFVLLFLFQSLLLLASDVLLVEYLSVLFHAVVFESLVVFSAESLLLLLPVVFLEQTLLVYVLLGHQVLVLLEDVVDSVLSLAGHLFVSFGLHLGDLVLSDHPVVYLDLLLFLLLPLSLLVLPLPQSFLRVFLGHRPILLFPLSLLLLFHLQGLLVLVLAKLSFYQVHLVLLDVSSDYLLHLRLDGHLEVLFLPPLPLSLLPVPPLFLPLPLSPLLRIVCFPRRLHRSLSLLHCHLHVSDLVSL